MAFLESVERIWEEWSIRGSVLFSLAMQIILIGLSPFRKLSGNNFMNGLIWCAYLLADAIATSAVGLIVKNQTYAAVQHSEEFLALWIPFLLLHLGGPDSITAYALEDNELYVRHFLGLITQGLAIGYLILQTFSRNNLRIPAMLLFIAGIIKYSERTCSLYLASKATFRDSMIRKPKTGGVNLVKLGTRIHLRQITAGAGIAGSTTPAAAAAAVAAAAADGDDREPQNLNDLEVVAKAHDYFKIFKGLMVDIVFSFKERDVSRKFFGAIAPRDAFRVIEAELNFMYEVLYTKVAVVHSPFGRCFRLVASCLVIAALVTFRFFINKRGFDKIDVGVTYALLLGTIGLDAFGFLMSTFSNWTLVAVLNRYSPDDSSFISKLLYGCGGVLPLYKSLLDLKKPRMYVCETDNHRALRTPYLFRKWSERVPCFNLITYCLKGRPVRIHSHMLPISAHTIMSSILLKIGKLCSAINDVWKKSMSCTNLGDNAKRINHFFRIDKFVRYLIAFKKKCIQLVYLTDFLDELTYVSREPLTEELWRFIFEELKKKSSSINDNQETPKEIFSARGDLALKRNGVEKDGIKLMHYVANASYDESLLLWHIATELLYSGEKRTGVEEDAEAREFSKMLADYMLFILIWRPAMMSAISGMAKLRYDDTCADAKHFFKKRGLRPQKVKTACKIVLDIDTDLQTSDFVKEDETLSVLFKACMLAKELRKLKADKWKVMSQVWVELLSYGASHCGATSHAQQLSKGGDLITFIWLLMGHFGLLDQFQPNSSLLSPEEKSSLARLMIPGLNSSFVL